MDMLEVKRATFRRDLDYMHDRLGVSILWHAEAGGYRLDASDGGARFEKVTCLWLNERKVSPQRVVFYRDNWYLDAFCHLRNEMRSFSIDALESAQETDRPAVSVDDAVLKEELESTYGIFAGKKKQFAQLKFSPFRARWVEKEVWHPDQRIERLPDGSLILQVPYGDDRELVHDILKQGKDVEVVAPAELRNKVRDELRAMLDRHQ